MPRSPYCEESHFDFLERPVRRFSQSRINYYRSTAKECSQADTYQNVNKHYRRLVLHFARRHLMVEGDYLNAISEGLDVLKSSAWVKTSFRVCRSLYLNISSCRLVVIVDIVLPYI